MSSAPDPAPRRPTVILFVEKQEKQAIQQAFPVTPWGAPWVRIFQGARLELEADFGIVLEMTGHATFPRVQTRPGLSVAFWCRNADLLEELREAPVTALIFHPDRLACLEARRRRRKTLVTLGAIRAGEILAPAHLGEEIGGTGVDAGLASALLGRVVAHDLRANQPVDLGSVLWRGETQPS